MEKKERIYQLYHNKELGIIKIEPLKSHFNKDTHLINAINELPEGEVKYYNQNYEFSKDRKALKKVALEMKEAWVTEARELLEKFEAIKV